MMRKKVVKINEIDYNFICQEVYTASVELKSFRIILSEFIDQYKANNSFVQIGMLDNNSNGKQRSTTLERQNKRNMNITNIPLFNDKNPLISSIKKFSDHSEFTRKDNFMKLFNQIDENIQKLTQAASIKDLLRYNKQKLNQESSIGNNQSTKVNMTDQIKISLERNLSSTIFDHLKEGLKLDMLYSTSYCDHYKSDLKELAKIVFEFKKESNVVKVNPNSVIQHSINILSERNIKSVKLSADFGSGKTRITINPLISNDTNNLNQTSSLCYPILLYTGKEDVNKIPDDIFDSIQIKKFLTTDLGFWFKISKTCPICGKKQSDFENESNEITFDDFKTRSFPFKADKFVICILHMFQRLITTVLESILNFSGEMDREMIFKKYMQENVRRNFDYSKRTENDNILEISCELKFWINFNECIQIIRDENLIGLLKLDDLEKSIVLDLLKVSNILLNEPLEYWENIDNINNYKMLIESFEKAFLQMNRLKHTYYSHYIIEHSLDQILELTEEGYRLFDFGNWNVENVHCLSNRYKKFKGKTTLVRKNNELYTKQYDENENELLKPLLLLLLYNKKNYEFINEPAKLKQFIKDNKPPIMQSEYSKFDGIITPKKRKHNII